MHSARLPLTSVLVLMCVLMACGSTSTSASVPAPSCSATAATCNDGPANTSAPAPDAATEVAALNGYLNAVSRDDCATAEKYALRSAFINGDFCNGMVIGDLAIDRWRGPIRRPTLAGESLYELQVHVSTTQDGTPSGWRDRFVTVRKLGKYFYIAGVATGP